MYVDFQWTFIVFVCSFHFPNEAVLLLMYFLLLSSVHTVLSSSISCVMSECGAPISRVTTGNCNTSYLYPISLCVSVFSKWMFYSQKQGLTRMERDFPFVIEIWSCAHMKPDNMSNVFCCWLLQSEKNSFLLIPLSGIVVGFQVTFVCITHKIILLLWQWPHSVQEENLYHMLILLLG